MLSQSKVTLLRQVVNCHQYCCQINSLEVQSADGNPTSEVTKDSIANGPESSLEVQSADGNPTSEVTKDSIANGSESSFGEHNVYGNPNAEMSNDSNLNDLGVSSANANNNFYSTVTSNDDDANRLEKYFTGQKRSSKHVTKAKEKSSSLSIQKCSSKKFKKLGEVSEKLKHVLAVYCRYMLIFSQKLQRTADQDKLEGAETSESSQNLASRFHALFVLLTIAKDSVSFIVDSLYGYGFLVQEKYFLYEIADIDFVDTVEVLIFCGKQSDELDEYPDDGKFKSEIYLYMAVSNRQKKQASKAYLISLEELRKDDVEDLTDCAPSAKSKPKTDEDNQKIPDTEVRIVPSEYFDEWAYHRVKEVVMTLLGGLEDARAATLTCVASLKCLRNSIPEASRHLETQIFALLFENTVGIIKDTLEFLGKENSSVKPILNVLENLYVEMFGRSNNSD